MHQLRWTLLLIGVLFIAVLAWWELRRPRQARGGFESRPPSELKPEPEDAVQPEVSISLPEMRARIPITELPVLRIAEDTPLGAVVEVTAAPPPPAPPPESAAPQGLPATAEPDAEPIVEWPPESERTVVALRLIAPTERFQGRQVRQALAAEGFVLGKYAIFHRPAADGRVVVSAASLTQPGTFDRDSIDRQRYGGLNLFAVLPGPLPAAKAFDELLGTARGLNERLQGALQDDHGDPLTPLRVAAIREVLHTDAAAAAGHS